MLTNFAGGQLEPSKGHTGFCFCLLMGYSYNLQSAEIKNACFDLRSHDQDKGLKETSIIFHAASGWCRAHIYSKVKLRHLHPSWLLPHFYSAVIEAHNVAAEVDFQDWSRARFSLGLCRVYTERAVHAEVDSERENRQIHSNSLDKEQRRDNTVTTFSSTTELHGRTAEGQRKRRKNSHLTNQKATFAPKKNVQQNKNTPP